MTTSVVAKRNIEFLRRRWFLKAKRGKGKPFCCPGAASENPIFLNSRVPRTSQGQSYFSPRPLFLSPAAHNSALTSIDLSNAPAGFARDDSPQSKEKRNRNSTNATRFFRQSWSVKCRGRLPSSSGGSRGRTTDAIPCSNSPSAGRVGNNYGLGLSGNGIAILAGPLLVIFEDAHWSDPTTWSFWVG